MQLLTVYYVLGLSEFGAQSILVFIRMYLYICIKLRSFQRVIVH